MKDEGWKVERKIKRKAFSSRREDTFILAQIIHACDSVVEGL